MLLRDDMDDMRSWKYQTSDQLKVTLLGTNISLSKAILKVSFLFPRWDMLIPWRVVELFQMVYPFLKYWSTGLKTSCFAKIIVISSPQKNWADFQRFFTLGDPEKQPTDLRSLDIAWGGWKKWHINTIPPKFLVNLPWWWIYHGTPTGIPSVTKIINWRNKKVQGQGILLTPQDFSVDSLLFSPRSCRWFFFFATRRKPPVWG